MQTANLRRISFIAGIVSLFVAYLGIWFQFINDPVQRSGSDFIGFYSVGRIARIEGAGRVYDPLLQQQIQEDVVGFPLAPGQVLLNQHLPFLIPILQAIADPDYVRSFYKWNLIMSLLYIFSFILLGLILNDAGLDRAATLLMSLGGILFYPLFFSFLNGQDTALLVLGTTVWLFGLLSGKEWIAGLGLSLATVRPHIVLLIALPLFFRYRKAFWGFMLGSALLAVISYLIISFHGIQEFINVLMISAEGQWYGLNEHAMLNFMGLLLRLLPAVQAKGIHLIGWLVYGFTTVWLCRLWAKNKDIQDGRIGLTVVVALMVAPHLHFHDLTLLLIPIYEWVRMSTQNKTLQVPLAIAAPIAISLLLLLGNAAPYVQYTIPYVLMLVLAFYPYYVKAQTSLTIPHRS